MAEWLRSKSSLRTSTSVMVGSRGGGCAARLNWAAAMRAVGGPATCLRGWGLNCLHGSVDEQSGQQRARQVASFQGASRSIPSGR